MQSLADNYKYCVWTADGELSCSGLKGSIELSKPGRRYSPCQSLIPVPKCRPNPSPRNQYINQYHFQPNLNQGGGYSQKDPLRYPLPSTYGRFQFTYDEPNPLMDGYSGSEYALFLPSTGPGQCLDYSGSLLCPAYKKYCGDKCREPSGPAVAQNGFDLNTFYTPNYYQPQRDSSHPQNQYFNTNLNTNPNPNPNPNQTGGGNSTLQLLEQGNQCHACEGLPGSSALLPYGLPENAPPGQGEYSDIGIYPYGSVNPEPVGTQYTTYPLTQSSPNKSNKTTYYQSTIPETMFKKQKKDLRYRASLQNLNADEYYENLLNSYNTENLYDQTDMDYYHSFDPLDVNDPLSNVRVPQGTFGSRESRIPHDPAHIQQPLPQQIGGSDATYDCLSTPQNFSQYSIPFSDVNHQTEIGLIPFTNTYAQSTNPNLNNQNLNNANMNQMGGNSYGNPINNLVYDPPKEERLQCPSYAQLLLEAQKPIAQNQSPEPMGTPNLSAAPVQLRPLSPWMRYEQEPNPSKKLSGKIIWTPKFKAKYRILSRELGAPYLFDQDNGPYAMWNQSSMNDIYRGIFKRVELDNDNVCAWVRVDVAEEDWDKLQVISPNLGFDRTRRWLIIREKTLKGALSLLTIIILYLNKELTFYNIERYELKKKYLWALTPNSKLYNPNAQRKFINIISNGIKKINGQKIIK